MYVIKDTFIVYQLKKISNNISKGSQIGIILTCFLKKITNMQNVYSLSDLRKHRRATIFINVLILKTNINCGWEQLYITE